MIDPLTVFWLTFLPAVASLWIFYIAYATTYAITAAYYKAKGIYSKPFEKGTQS